MDNPAPAVDKPTPPIANVLFLVLGVGMVWIGLSGLWGEHGEASDLATRGVKATATCERVVETSGTKYHKWLAVTLTFKGADGPHTATVNLPRGTAMYPRQQVDVVYDPQHPEVVSLPAFESRATDFLKLGAIALLGAIVALVGVLGLVAV